MSGAGEPARPAGAGALPGFEGSPFDSIMPVVLFIVVNRLAGLGWAIAAATAWSVKVAVTRKRRGSPIGRFLPLITAGILVRGLIGILTDSEAVYFGIGIATKAAIGVVVIGSAVVGRNLVARYAPLAFGFDAATVAHPVYRSAMDRVAWAVGAAQLASAAFDVWLFERASVDSYLVVRFFVNWPLTTVVLVGSIAYLSRRLAAIPGFPGVNALLEARLAEYDEGVRRRRGRAAG